MINKDIFLKNLAKVDFLLEKKNFYLNLYIAGGIAISFYSLKTRPTQDVDVFNNMSKDIEEILNKYNINTEISQIIKDETYIKYSKEYENNKAYSNIRLYITSVDYLFTLKILETISPNRTI